MMNFKKVIGVTMLSLCFAMTSKAGTADQDLHKKISNFDERFKDKINRIWKSLGIFEGQLEKFNNKEFLSREEADRRIGRVIWENKDANDLLKLLRKKKWECYAFEDSCKDCSHDMPGLRTVLEDLCRDDFHGSRVLIDGLLKSYYLNVFERDRLLLFLTEIGEYDAVYHLIKKHKFSVPKSVVDFLNDYDDAMRSLKESGIQDFEVVNTYASLKCASRGIKPGPEVTYEEWLEIGAKDDRIFSEERKDRDSCVNRYNLV